MAKVSELTEKTVKESSPLISWIIIGLLLFLILFKGVATLLFVGNQGQPDWDYGTVPDVPAESPYAEYRLLPFPQHVEGERGE